MNINEFMIDALSPLGIPVVERLYEGDETEFITFNIADSMGADYGDDSPWAVDYYVQVHYVCPWMNDYSGKARQIRRLLHQAGATYPQMTDASDPATRIRHLVFESVIENSYDLEEEENV